MFVRCKVVGLKNVNGHRREAFRQLAENLPSSRFEPPSQHRHLGDQLPSDIRAFQSYQAEVSERMGTTRQVVGGLPSLQFELLSRYRHRRDPPYSTLRPHQSTGLCPIFVWFADQNTRPGIRRSSEGVSTVRTKTKIKIWSGCESKKIQGRWPHLLWRTANLGRVF